jgi:ubiquinone/menaquinone biosynthesis C-methylase UbiE
MATKLRWKQAQSYEKSFWSKAAAHFEREAVDGLSWYSWRADNLRRLLTKAFPDSVPEAVHGTVVEVGSGPVGLVSNFDAKERCAIDPLCDYYSSKAALTKHRNPDVIYKAGKGEELPFENSSCDMLVIENVIDHVQDADAVMSEISRVLKDNAVLYLTVNLHPNWGAFLHNILSVLRIDKGHPYTFNLKKIRAFLASHGYKMLYEEWEDYRECRAKDLKSDSFSDRLKAIGGLSEYLYSTILIKSRTQ